MFESIDWSAVIGAAVGIGVGIVATLYVKFRAAAKADGVDNWKDDVVEGVEGFKSKTDGE